MIRVHVEAVGPTLRVFEARHHFFHVRRLAPDAVIAPGRIIVTCDPPTFAIPFGGVYLPRPEWVW